MFFSSISFIEKSLLSNFNALTLLEEVITLFIFVIYVFLYSGVFPNIVIEATFSPHAI